MNRVVFIFLVTSVCVASVSAAEKLSQEEVEFFERKVRPVLVQHCYACHSSDAKSIKGGLVLDTKAGWHAGGDSGPAIVPGKPEESSLISAINYEDFEMPPKGQLSEQQIRDLTRWVEMGAPDPRDEQAKELIKRDIDIESGRKFWAFQPPVSTSLPAVQNDAWPINDLDYFILEKLEAKKLQPVGDASARVLARRLYFDLIGLPPTPKQVTDFVEAAQHDRQAAIETLVDRLLASPQFGQRWGRHWLDVARYAESSGMERNVTFTEAWRYRDWVIDAFNTDKPFDQFLTEQIAGDLLPNETIAQHNANLIATGFLAMGPKSLNERNKNIFQMDVVDEQIDVTTRAFMGITVSCARCHDHKFDPFPTKDYYALAGIFRSCETLHGAAGGNGNRQPSALMPLKTVVTEAPADGGEAPLAVDKSVQRQLQELNRKVQSTKAQVAVLSAKLQKKNQLQPKERREIQLQLAELRKLVSKENAQQKKLRTKLSKKPSKPTGPAAMAVVDGKVDDCAIHVRGEVTNLGETVPRGFLQVVSLDNQPVVPDSQSGRLELARWMTHGDNPLTARVFANRAWHWLFGQGIVRTVDNFGEMGERPVNQPLLDHLAIRFVENDWSVKQLVREIVTSRTYGLASSGDDANFQIDPENQLNWRQNHRRLDAESIRDAMLSLSGNLNLAPAGPSPVSKFASTNIGRDAKLLAAISGDGFRHRSVYMPIVRNEVPEMLSIFDFAEPSILVGRRQLTTVPSQALYLMNSDFVYEQASAIADKISNGEEMDTSAHVRRAFRLILSRPATDDEIKRCCEFIKMCVEDEEFATDTKSKHPQQAALASLCQALLASAEFRYIE